MRAYVMPLVLCLVALTLIACGLAFWFAGIDSQRLPLQASDPPTPEVAPQSIAAETAAAADRSLLLRSPFNPRRQPFLRAENMIPSAQQVERPPSEYVVIGAYTKGSRKRALLAPFGDAYPLLLEVGDSFALGRVVAITDTAVLVETSSGARIELILPFEGGISEP